VRLGWAPGHLGPSPPTLPAFHLNPSGCTTGFEKNYACANVNLVPVNPTTYMGAHSDPLTAYSCQNGKGQERQGRRGQEEVGN